MDATEVTNESLWRDVYSRRLDQLADRQEAMQASLDRNIEATSRIEVSTLELVTLLQSWKGAMHMLELAAKVLKPIGYIATATAALWGLFAAIKGGK